MIYYFIRLLFHALVLRPFMYLWVGFNTTGEENLPTAGPAIIVCNHNSHLDSYAIAYHLRLRLLNKIRPVAAADYFLRNKWLAWYTTKVLRIIPVERGRGDNKEHDPFVGCHEAIDKNHILIIYPEGTRDGSEELSEFKKGVAWLAAAHPDVPVIPMHIRGLGNVLPKGSWLPVPFFCDVAIGAPRYGHDDKDQFITDLRADIEALADESGMQTS